MVEKLLRLEPGIEIIETSGKTRVLYRGRTLSLADALEAFAEEHPELADGRTLRSTREAAATRAAEQERTRNSEPPKTARDSMTLSQKVQFIEKFGLDAYTKLASRSENAAVDLPPVAKHGTFIDRKKIAQHNKAARL